MFVSPLYKTPSSFSLSWMCFFVVAFIFHSETKIVVDFLIAYSGLGLCVRSRLDGLTHGRWCEEHTGRGGSGLENMYVCACFFLGFGERRFGRVLVAGLR